jgi:DivIVA domain-containing protein
MTDLVSTSSLSTSQLSASAPSISSSAPRSETSSEFSPSAISQRRFGTAFRGLDADEVRTYLQRVSSHLKGLHEQMAGLTTELEAARSARVVDLTDRSDFTDESGESSVPRPARSAEEQQVIADAESAARTLLDDAQREAKAIIDRANDESGRILLRARAESRGKQPDGSRVLVGDAAVPDGSPAIVPTSSITAGPRGVAAMSSGTGEAIFDVPDDPEVARVQARAMIQEARAVRERILTDLGKRRRTAHVQLEQLRVAREKLQETLREARRVIDASSRDVTHAEVEARLAAEAAGRRVNAEPMPTVEQLEVEVMGGRHMSVFRPTDLPEPETDDATMAAHTLNDAPSDSHDDVKDPTVPLRVEDLIEEGLMVSPEVSSAETPITVSEHVTADDNASGTSEIVAASVAVTTTTSDDAAPATDEVVLVVETLTEKVDEAAEASSEMHSIAVDADVDADTDAAESTELAESAESSGAAVPAEAVRTETLRTETVRTETQPTESVLKTPAEDVKAPKSASKAKGSTRPARKKKDVDDVFARIRAEREDAAGHRTPQVNHGTSALAPALVPVIVASEVPEIAAEVAPMPSGDDSVSSDDRETAILERRNHDMELLQLRVSKQLKRYLQDEHSAALSSVRRARGKLTVDALLDTLEVQHSRAAAVVSPALLEATQAGVRAAESFGYSSVDVTLDVAPGVDVHAERMASDLLDPIRSVLQSALDAHSADIPALLGQAFREWNTDRLGRHVRDVLSAAFAAGLVGAVPAGVPMHWLVDHGDEPSPECDDNALAGTVTNRETFPTGHSVPPLGPGCRCLVVPRRVSPPTAD